MRPRSRAAPLGQGLWSFARVRGVRRDQHLRRRQVEGRQSPPQSAGCQARLCLLRCPLSSPDSGQAKVYRLLRRKSSLELFFFFPPLFLVTVKDHEFPTRERCLSEVRRYLQEAQPWAGDRGHALQLTGAQTPCCF